MEAQNLLEQAEAEAGLIAYIPNDGAQGMGRYHLKAFIAMREAREKIRRTNSVALPTLEGRVEQALSAHMKQYRRNPNDMAAGNVLACLFAWFDKPEEYKEVVAMLLDKAETLDSLSPYHNRTAALSATLRPLDNAILDRAAERARAGLRFAGNSLLLGFSQLSIGIVQYRQGQYEAAERSLNVAILNNNERPQRALEMLFRAMTRHKLGKSEAAIKDFVIAKRLMAPIPERGILTGALLSESMYKMPVWLAYEEAKPLFETN